MQQAQSSMFGDIDPIQQSTASKKAFAEHVGVTQGRVSQLIKSGLPVEPNGRIHIERGIAWMRDNIDPNRRRAAIGDRDPSQASSAAGPMSPRGMRDVAEARIAQLKADRLAGLLISRKATLRAVEGRAKMEADALISWVNRAAPAIATATGGNLSTIAGVLDREIRAHLISMANTALDLPK